MLDEYETQALDTLRVNTSHNGTKKFVDWQMSILFIMEKYYGYRVLTGHDTIPEVLIKFRLLNTEEEYWEIIGPRGTAPTEEKWERLHKFIYEHPVSALRRI